MALFTEVIATRTQAQAAIKAARDARMSDPSVVAAAGKSLDAIKAFLSSKFKADYYAEPGVDQTIAVRFGYDPATEERWDPAVAALVAQQINAQQGPDTGHAEVRRYDRDQLMGDPGCHTVYVVVGESAEAVTKVPTVTSQSDLNDPWPFEDQRDPYMTR